MNQETSIDLQLKSLICPDCPMQRARSERVKIEGFNILTLISEEGISEEEMTTSISSNCHLPEVFDFKHPNTVAKCLIKIMNFKCNRFNFEPDRHWVESRDVYDQARLDNDEGEIEASYTHNYELDEPSSPNCLQQFWESVDEESGKDENEDDNE